MDLALLSALAGGVFVTTATLWAFGVGGTAHLAAARLQALRGGPGRETPEVDREVSLRQRSPVQLVGINVVSSNIAARWAVDLERAGLTLNAKEYLIARLTLGLVISMIGMLFSPIALLGLVGLPIGYWAVGFWVKRRIESRRRKLEAQLIELLEMVASGLRAGFGFIQSMESASSQMPTPIATEIKRSLRDISMGATVETSLEALNQRVGSSDFDIVITAILIQRSVGGNLAEILESVAHTMRERERIRGEVRALTSQQRMTGYVIGAIPPGLLVVFMIISPEFSSQLFTDPLGRIMLGAGVAMEAMGFFVIQRIVNIEV